MSKKIDPSNAVVTNFKDSTGKKGSKNQIRVILPTGTVLSAFPSKEKYRIFKKEHGKAIAPIKYHIEFFKINSEKGDQIIMTYGFPAYGIEMRKK